MNMQEHLIYITSLNVKNISPRLRGVISVWNELENMASLSFYFDGKPTEDELEEASSMAGEIIAHCSNATLEENYICLNYPKPLPQNPYWAYKRPEEKVV